MYTLDTNAVIYYLRGDSSAVRILEDIFTKDVPIYISALSEAELFGYPHLTASETTQIDSLLKTLSIIPVDSRIARTAGFLRRTYGLKLADSVIAATALFTGTTLLTRNVSDFRRISELSLLRI